MPLHELQRLLSELFDLRGVYRHRHRPLHHAGDLRSELFDVFRIRTHQLSLVRITRLLLPEQLHLRHLHRHRLLRQWPQLHQLCHELQDLHVFHFNFVHFLHHGLVPLHRQPHLRHLRHNQRLLQVHHPFAAEFCLRTLPHLVRHLLSGFSDLLLVMSSRKGVQFHFAYLHQRLQLDILQQRGWLRILHQQLPRLH